MKPHKSEGVKRLIAEIPASLYVRFKVECYQQGLSIKDVVLSFVESWLGGDSEIEIQPAKRNPGSPERSIEEIVERIIEKKFGQIDIETESAAGPVDVHNVAEPVEVEEPEEIAEENEEPAVVEEPVEVEKQEDLKPRKKKMAGLWPYVKEADVEEKKPDDQKPRKKRGLWPWVR
ncbi:hypothetical protein ES705_46232 [subsurface metagenome]